MNFRQPSRLCTGMTLLAALAIISAPHTAIAQTETSQPAAQPAMDFTQNSTAEEKATLEPRRIAAAVVAAGYPTPHMIVQVGASTGALLETFLDRMPTAHGEWVEAVTSEHNLPRAHARLDRFGDRVDFKFGCARRDLGPGCNLPKDTDAIIMDWLSIQQNLDSMTRIYKTASDKLPSEGWLVNLDHVTFSDSSWAPLLQTAVKGFRPEFEGPPIHYPQFRVPTADEQLTAMRAAGFEAQVVWQSFTTALIIGRKK